MPSDNYDITKETIFKIVGIALSGILLALGRWLLKGVKFSYKYYQEKKSVTVSLSWRLYFWSVVTMIGLQFAGVLLHIGIFRTETKVAFGTAYERKVVDDHIHRIDSLVPIIISRQDDFAVGLKYLLKEDSLRVKRRR